MPTYYDLVLALIPVSLVGVSGSAIMLGSTFLTGVLIGGLIALILIGHALFIRSPVPETVNPNYYYKESDLQKEHNGVGQRKSY